MPLLQHVPLFPSLFYSFLCILLFSLAYLPSVISFLCTIHFFLITLNDPSIFFHNVAYFHGITLFVFMFISLDFFFTSQFCQLILFIVVKWHFYLCCRRIFFCIYCLSLFCVHSTLRSTLSSLLCSMFTIFVFVFLCHFFSFRLFMQIVIAIEYNHRNGVCVCVWWWWWCTNKQ